MSACMELKIRYMTVFLAVYYLTMNEQILVLVADNSNNNTMVNELDELIPTFQGSQTRIRCFTHILNLVVKVCHHNFSF
jgi:hypothetical protein